MRYCTAHAEPDPKWHAEHDRLVERLQAVSGKAGAFGPEFEPLYRAAISWYGAWGGRNDTKVDNNMVGPEAYATELATALEQGRNFIEENPGALFPLAFERTLSNGKVVTCNYWLSLPAGFPRTGGPYPLIVDLHGSGWLGHKISFVRGKGCQLLPNLAAFIRFYLVSLGFWTILSA
jgi:hypothetical protein